MPLTELVLKSLMRLPDGVLRSLSGGRTERDGQLLDAQSQFFIKLANLVDRRERDEMSVGEARAQLEKLTSMAHRPSGLDKVEDRALGGVPTRVYRPHGIGRRSPAVVYFHGGGWVVGNLDTHHALCVELARQARVILVSVDYRLAPEHAFPAAVDDGLAAFRAVVEAADALGIDPARVAVAGDSAGGNLAAVVAAEAAADEHPPAFQLLNYPVTDVSAEAGSYTTFGSGLFLTARAMRWFIGHYTPEPWMRGDPRASPLLRESLEGLCPARVVVAGFDPLRDEGLAYAERLRDAGVDVELVVEASAPHGFLSTAALIRISRRGVETAARALRAALAEPRA